MLLKFWGANVLGFPREIEPIGYICRYIEVYSEGLTHKVVAAGMSFRLLSASWRPRKASGVVPAKPRGLRTGPANGVSSCLSLKAREPECEV